MKMMDNLRSFIRKIMLDVFSYNSKPSPGVHILNGHFLSRNNNASHEIFESLLTNLKRNGVEYINFDEAASRIFKNEIPDNQCLVAFSFDDGFEECFTKIGPVLDKFNIKAAFFVNPGVIEGNDAYKNHFKENVVLTDKNPMSWEQVQSLHQQGHTIGAHTIDHQNLNSDDISMLEHQIGNCKKTLEERLAYKCKYFAYPFGKLEDISEKAVDIAKMHHDYVFSQSNYRHYFSFNGKIINRRHFECDWPYKHVVYFLKDKSK